MKPTILDFQKAVIERKIMRWGIRNCSICEYPLAYLFLEDNSVHFDSGCWCVTPHIKIRFSSWQAVLDFYLAQTDENVIKSFNAFWGFNNEHEP